MIDRLGHKLVGYWVRAGVFMFGEYKANPFKRLVMEFLKTPPSDDTPRLGWFNAAHAEHSITLLEQLGGVRSNVQTLAGDQVDSLFIRYADVKKKIEEMGGYWTSDWSGRQLIYGKNPNDPKWKSFYAEVLSHMGWEETDYKGKRALIPYAGKLLSPSGCFYHLQSAAGCIGFQRKFIGQVLAQQCDYFSVDFPGVGRSTGRPSEGAYNAAGEAGLHRLIELGYGPKNLIVLGNCLGGATACYLKGKYPRIGRLLLDRPFADIEPVLRGQNLLAPYGIDELLSSDWRLHALQNRFKTAEWLSSEKKEGKIVLAFTDNDTVVGPTREAMLKAAEKAARETVEILYKNPNQKREGHTIALTREPELWRKCVEALSNRSFLKVPFLS